MVPLVNPNGSFITACCWFTLVPLGKPKPGVGAPLLDTGVATLLDCIPSNAANGLAADAAAGFSG